MAKLLMSGDPGWAFAEEARSQAAEALVAVASTDPSSLVNLGAVPTLVEVGFRV